MKYVIYFVLAVATLSPLCAFGQTDSGRHVNVPPSVSKLVTPILDAVEEGHNGPGPMNEEKGSPLWRAGELVGRLFDNRSAASDEALVALLYYYLGEANGGDQMEEIICRGKRMLPYLRKYQSSPPEMPQRQYPKELLLAPETVAGNFRDAIGKINKGKSAIACQSRP